MKNLFFLLLTIISFSIIAQKSSVFFQKTLPKIIANDQSCDEFNPNNKDVSEKVKNNVACDIADRCEDISNAHILVTNPTSLDCSVFQKTSIYGCLTGASPEDSLTDCGFSFNPTVWFEIRIDVHAVRLITDINTSGNWNPEWAIYTGTCQNLQLVAGGDVTNPNRCSSDGNPAIHTISIPSDPDGNPITSFFIAVSTYGILDDPEFILSAFTQAGCGGCIGNETCETQANFEVISRSSNRPLNDPVFCQGENVEICLDFFYAPEESGIDWFHGVIPNFGRGWDMESFDPTTVTTIPEGAVWMGPDDVECAPYVKVSMPLLCTYTDEDGNLKICNIKCGSCPCSPPLDSASLLPNGWFWSSNGGFGCENTCNPSTSYGVPGSNSGLNVKICMQLRTKVLEGQDCPDFNDLQITYTTTSDGVSGCWGDFEYVCRLDVTQVGPVWELDCNAPPQEVVVFQNEEITHGETLESSFTVPEDSTLVIFVIPIPNENVFGMNAHVFLNSNGIVRDRLFNISDSVQKARYLVYTQRGDIVCGSLPDTFTVTIQSVSNIHFTPIILCEDSCLILEAVVPGTVFNYKSIFWNTEDTTQSILVCPTQDESYFAFVETTDSSQYVLHYTIQVGKIQTGIIDADSIECGDFQLTMELYGGDSNLDNIFYELYSCNNGVEEFIFRSPEPIFLTYPVDNAEIEYCFKLKVNHNGCVSEVERTFENPNYFIGKPCDDLDPETINDVYGEDCICKGEIDISTNGFDLANEFKIYPNPTNSSVFVSGVDALTHFEVSLINSVGESVYVIKSKTEDGYELMTSALPSGMYMIKIHLNTSTLMYKLVKY